MSEWKKVKLGEVCDFINGGAWSDKEYVSEGIPVLKVTNCKNSGFSLSEISYLPFSSNQKYSQNELQLHDVIIATVGSHPNLVNSSAGRSAIVNSFVTGFFLNQNAVCIRTKDANILNQLYFGYYSKYYLFQNYIQMRGKGAANQMRIAISSIKAYPMPLPPIEHQSYIATILSRYDSLIENYQKQIKLLEEAAQRLYKEWFIDLRFPGHENTKIVDGVPEGWNYYRISEKYKTVLGGTPSRAKSNYWGGNIPWINSGEINKLRVINASEMITQEGYDNSSTKLMPIHTTILAITGATLGQVSYTEIETCANQSVVGIIDESNQTNEYLYLNISNNILSIVNKATGGAQQHINKDIVNDYHILVPEDKTLTSFKKLVSPMFALMKELLLSIESLTEARDRLLPKLMSGEIELGH